MPALQRKRKAAHLGADVDNTLSEDPTGILARRKRQATEAQAAVSSLSFTQPV